MNTELDQPSGVVFSLLEGIRIDPRVSCMPGKSSTSELRSSSVLESFMST